MTENIESGQQPVHVNHPNFIPDPSQSSKFGPFNLDPTDLRSKPPSGLISGHSDGLNKAKVFRSVSHDGTNGNKVDASDTKNRGSVGSFGSCDSKTYDEEVVISYQDEAVNIEEQGAGK